MRTVCLLLLGTVLSTTQGARWLSPRVGHTSAPVLKKHEGELQAATAPPVANKARAQRWLRAHWEEVLHVTICVAMSRDASESVRTDQWSAIRKTPVVTDGVGWRMAAKSSIRKVPPGVRRLKAAERRE